MAAISAKMVKELRDKTGAGMMECKKALVAAEGDQEKAIDELRKAGIKKAAKKADRETNEGKIVAVSNGNNGAIVELLCETDFVSGSDKFTEFSKELGQRAADFAGTECITEAFNAAELDNLNELTLIVSEKCNLRRAVRWESEGQVASYIHGNGRIGVMVDVEGEVDAETLSDLCMHIAAFNPPFIDESEVSEEFINRELEIAKAQLGDKPAEIMEKILIGKKNKMFSEVCLVKQPWVKDDKSCFAKIAPKATIKRFVRWQLGEEV